MGIQCKEIQADFGHSKNVVFANVHDKLKARMTGWAKQFLSQVGKEVFVKAVTMALPNYVMSVLSFQLGCAETLRKQIITIGGEGMTKGRAFIGYHVIGL